VIPLIGLLLSIYLAFKGLEIFQIAYSNKESPAFAMVIGIGALVAACLIGGVFAILFITSAAAVPNLPTLTTP
jgi:hypothetical protein